ncbi:hypothetical protein ABPG75_001052 [Micractinium tetrahymenae]
MRRLRFRAAAVAALAVLACLFAFACTSLYCASACGASSCGTEELSGIAALHSGAGWAALPTPPPQRPHPRILLRYMACMGGFNQLYSHVAALTLAAALGADVVLPPALARETYDSKSDPLHRKTETMQWHAAPAESLLDVARIAQAWRQLGINVQPPPQLYVLPADLRTGFLSYPQPAFQPQQVVRLKGVNRKPKEFGVLLGMARAAVRDAVAAALAAGLPPFDTIVLDLPCTLFSLNTDRVLGLTSKVALSLHFSPHLQALADRIVAAVTDGGRRPFNGLHLRLETDALFFHQSQAGQQKAWEAYIEGMRESGFNASLPVYVASGLLTYNSTEQWHQLVDKMRALGLAAEVLHKEKLLRAEELQGLHMEQVAVLDFLVLARAQRVVGLAASTFSTYLREYRALHGIPKATARLVGDTPRWFEHTVALVEDLGEEQSALQRLRQWQLDPQLAPLQIPAGQNLVA